MFCKKCDVEVPSKHLLSHLRNYHGGETDLEIVCPGCECERQFSTIPYFQKHWYSIHHVSKRKRKESTTQIGEPSSSKKINTEEAGLTPEGRLCEINSRDVSVVSAVVSEESRCENSIQLLEPQAIGDEVMDLSEGELSDKSSSVSSDDDDCALSGKYEAGALNVGSQTVASSEHESVNKLAASFVLKLREHCNASSESVKSILLDTEEIVATCLKEFASQVNNSLKKKNLSLSNAMNVNYVISTLTSNVFNSLKTDYQQKKYFKEVLGVVQPVRVPLGREFRRVRRKNHTSISTVAVEEEFVYVPIPSIVEKLINHPDYEYLVKSKAMEVNNDCLDSYMKGEKCKRNPVLQKCPDALRFILYYDDLECCSPLKSRAGNQKLGAFYLYLDNIPAKFRSNLSVISLVALVNAKLIKDKKYGMDAALQQIVNDLKKFEEGIVMSNGKKVFGTLIAFIGDNLGLHAIGGFKEGFTAHRCCRFCSVTFSALQNMVKEDVSLLRDEKLHNEQCAKVQTQRGKNEALRKEYGVNRNSVLNSLNSFHVVYGLPPDQMHDWLEGSLPLTVKNFLRHHLFEVDKPHFTLDWLNKSIRDFDFDYVETSDKPSELKRDFIMSEESTSLHQSASQMWLLGTILPLILGQFFDSKDLYYINLLDCLEIGRVIFTTEISKWMVAYLQDLIETYLSDFISLYGHLIPKQHHLIHYPSFILEFGSLVNYNCIRCEAKHKYFKNIVNLLGNYKNIPLTLSDRHQLSQAAAWAKSLMTSSTNGPIFPFSMTDLDIAALFPAADEDYVETNWLKFEGNKFVRGRCFICVGVDINSLPIFAKVRNVIIKPQVMFVCDTVQTVSRSVHLAAYEIALLTNKCLFKPEDMVMHSVFHAHKVKDSLYIALKYCAGDALF